MRYHYILLLSIVLIAVVLTNTLQADEPGSIVGWGGDDNDLYDIPTPNKDFVRIAALAGHCLGLKSNGSIVAWGNKPYNLCDVPEPNTGFIAVAAGCRHALAIKTDGSITAWGWNASGQCDVPSPNTGFVAIAAGEFHSLGLKADGSIVAWGGKANGQCDVPEPNTGFVAIAAGYRYSIGLKADGSIVAWGHNTYGQCDVPLPNTDFVAIATGYDHSLGLKADGSVVAWGANWSGQCNVPLPNNDFVAIAGGFSHSLGLKADSSVIAWGDNRFGQCEVPVPNTGFTAIATKYVFNMGLKGGMVETGSLQVTIEPQEAIEVGAQWRRVGTTVWNDSNNIEAGIPVGECSIEFKDVPGYVTPYDQTETINPNSTLYVTASYVYTDTESTEPFKRGVNLTNWLQTSSVQQIDFTKFTKQDFINIKSLGCDVIRLPINLHYMTKGEPDYTIDPLLYYYLDQIIDWAEELELHLILDNHSFNTAVDTSTDIGDILIPMWTQMAQYYKDRSTYVYYEVLNEPHGISDMMWNQIQQQVIDAIRAVDQTHTIIVGPAGLNSYDNLQFMPEYEDDNLIYTFHFYDPFLFTHQGASWTDPSLELLAGVPFPYDAGDIPDCPPELQNSWVKGALENYQKTGTMEHVKDLIDIAVDFQTIRDVTLFCGELGVYKPNSNDQDRIYWYNIVRNYLEEKGIPWTMWDYKGDFGLFKQGTNELFEYDLNIPLVEALGFTAPQPAHVFYDDFVYTHSSDPDLSNFGWHVRSEPGDPGVEGAQWKIDQVTFVDDPTDGGDRLLRMGASTSGIPEESQQSEIATDKVFLEGTYAARVRLTDSPVYGPDVDIVVQAFFSINTLRYDYDLNYSECDFEYLPNGGWDQLQPTMFVNTWETYRPEPWDPISDSYPHPGSLDDGQWHILRFEISKEQVKYFIDNTLIKTSNGMYYPESVMSIAFQNWFSSLLESESEHRQYEFYVDWVLHAKDCVLTDTSIKNLISNYRSQGLNRLSTIILQTIPEM